MKTAAAFLLAVILSAMASPNAAGPQQKQVLVVHSYHETQQGHVVEMTEGIVEGLEGSGADIEFFHMDTKRRTSPEWKQEAGRLAAAAADKCRPDVIIAMDDNAQQYFAMEYAKRPDCPPLVFSGVNADPAKYGFPTDDVTGVLERPNIVESFELLLKIAPDTRKVAVFTDCSPTTDAFVEYCKTLDLPVEIVAYEAPRTFDEWQQAILKHRDSVDAFGVYVIRTIKRSADHESCVPENELVAWMNEHGGLPAVGFFDSAARAGLLCGISVSMHEQGFAAGKIAKALLQGAKPADFTPAPTAHGRILLNLKTAEQLGIDIRYNIIKNAEEVIR